MTAPRRRWVERSFELDVPIEAFPDFPLPTIGELIELTVANGKLTNKDIRCVGISINTSSLPDDEREAYLAKLSDEYGLPCVDPGRGGVGRLVDAMVGG